MSLFKARDWWHSVAGEGEQFDQGCLCIGNVDNSTAGKSKDKIVVGSYHGILRIYNPSSIKTESGWTGFRPEDVMLEQDLNAPILQLAIGLFVSGSSKCHLAVLQPRKLSIFSVSGVGGAVQHGAQYQLITVHEHKLLRSAYNMSHGPFGQVQGKDFICVQSVDGSLSIFEQDSFSFTRFLPGSLLPGPLQYVAQTDSFVTVSSSRHLESYRYQVLAIATDTKTKEESQNVKSGKKVTADWAYQLGEQATSLQVVNLPGVPLSILVLGKHSVFCVNEYGKLRFAKKLEYGSSYIHAYATVNTSVMNYIVSSHSNTLMVYADTTLKWAAHIEKTPVQISVANFDSLKGVIVCLSEDGHINCCYLGTDPAMMVMPSSQLQEINYDEQDTEMKRLQALIKEKSSSGGSAALSALRTKKGGDEDIQVTVHIPTELDTPTKATDVTFEDDDRVPSITIQVDLKARMTVSNLQVSLHINQPLVSTEVCDDIIQLGTAQDVSLSFVVYMKYNYLPTSVGGEVSLTYLNQSGAPRVLQTRFTLPAKLVIKPAAPLKTATYKVTVDTNKPPVNLSEIFGDLLGMSSLVSAAAVGFQYYGGSPSSVVTLLVSKTSQRYRLQSDDFAAMWLITSELTSRLGSYYKRAGGCECSVSGPLPLQEYLETIDAHFEHRVQAEKYKELMEQRAAQFRVIQRRLLTRFKDKTPTPLSNLDTLLEGTYRQMLALADGAEDNKKALHKAANALSCSTRLFNFLIRLSSNMTEDSFSILQAALSPNVDDGDQGWEETVDAALTHLLRTTLSKSTIKDQAINPSPVSMPNDTSKLKKHVALLCERLLSKGLKLTASDASAENVGDTAASAAAEGASQARGPQQKNSDESGDSNDPPAAIRFGEKRSPRANKESVTHPASRFKEPGSGRLPALDDSGGAGRGGVLGSLPALQTGTGDRRLAAKTAVPDLDELTMGVSGGSGDDDTLDV